MKFEIINANGRCMQSTTYAECIPYNFFDSMAANGYKFRVDGKIIPKNKVKAAVEESLGLTKTTKEDAKVEKETPIEIHVDEAKHPDVTSMNMTNPSKGRAGSKIICIEDGKEFNSQSDAAKFYSISPMSISNSVKSGKAVKGHTFKKV